jgi:hypothetical protein
LLANVGDFISGIKAPELFKEAIKNLLDFWGYKQNKFNVYGDKMQKFSINQYSIETVLAWIKAGEIAIPEIQRLFVWDSSKARDLIDSLYQ